MATAAEVEQWKDLCRKLTAVNNNLSRERDDAVTQHLRAEDKRKTAEAVADGLEWQVQELKSENEKLRELVQYILDESYGDDWFAMKAYELGFEANY